MADYFQVKNQNIFNPPANTSLGNTSTQFSNVYVQNSLVVGNVSVTGSTIITPRVTTITYPGNDTAADTAGGQTITLTGSGFVAGAGILINSITVSVVSVVSSTVITFTSPANTTGSYVLYVINSDGSTAISIPGIQYSGTPTWTTTAGSLGSVYEYSPISNTVAATGDGSITYSVFSGTLPTSSSLNTSTGVITGTSPASAGATTYTFVIRATDAQLQDSDRSFSITVNTDVVTWSSPAANSTVTLPQNAASTTALSATSAADKAITYTSTTLPAGLSISGAAVTGTPTVLGTTATTFTATAATTGRTTTATINWTVSVAADTYFPYTTLLLSGAAATETFIADASVNNFALTIAGDTKPNNFNPYTPGYYSNYFSGTSDYLSSSITALGTGNFTIEFWVYLLVLNNAGELGLFQISATSGGLQPSYTNGVVLYNNGSGYFGINVGGTIITSTYSILVNSWMHIAITRTSGTCNLYVNGTSVVTPTSASASLSGTYLAIGGYYNTSFLSNAYISNFRIVKDVAVYTGNFAVPTAPLSATQSAGTNIAAITTGTATSLLTCQSNRFVDNSTNLFTLTKAGSPKIQSFTPFVPNTAYAAYGSTYFDGNGDTLTVPHNVALNLSTGNFTLEAWVYWTGANVTGHIINKDGVSGSYYCVYNLGFVASKLCLEVGPFNQQVSSASNFPTNQWVHVAGVKSGTTLTVYQNGVSVATATQTGTMTDGGRPVLIGYETGQSQANYWDGYISNARIVKGVAVYTGTFTPPATPLSVTQSSGTNIAAITGSATSLLTCQTNQPASNSMFLDSSTNAFAVTRAGNVSAGTFTPYGANWSNYFDGTGQAFYNSSFTGTNFGTSNFTIEMWVLWSASAASNQTVFELTGTRRIIIGRSSTGIRYFNDGTERGYTVTVPVGTWNHIAIVRVSNTTNIYLNGVSGTSFVDNVSWAETQFYVGRNSDGAELTSAMYLSNLRVVNGTAVYTSNFAIPTAPLTAISGTTLLICKSNSFIDNSANAFGVTLIGTPSVQRFSPFAPQTQTAITHSAYFDGTGDYLTVPQNAAYNFGTGDFTIEGWYYLTAIVTDQALAILGTGASGGGPYTGWWLRYQSLGQLNLYRYDGTETTYTFSTTLVVNTWYHIACTRSGTSLRMFVNGAQVGTTATSSLSFNNVNSDPLQIGKVITGQGTFYYNGYVSNIRVVKGVAVYTGTFTPPTTPLTATQSAGTNIAAITGTQTSLLTCQSPTFTDNSTNLFAITAFDGAKPRTLNPFGFTNASAAYSAATYGGSAFFDGNADYLSTGPYTGQSMFTPSYSTAQNVSATIEFWIYPTTTGAGRPYSYATSSVSSGPNVGMFCVTNGSGSSYSIYFGWYNQGVDYNVTGGAALPNTWTHVAFTYNPSGGVGTLYVNGVRVGTVSGGNVNGGPPNSITNAYNYIGAYSPGSGPSYFTGYISDFRYTTNSILYTSNFVPPAAPLTAIATTSLLLNMTSAGVYDSASMSNLETVADAKLVATHTPYAGSFYSNYSNSSSDYLTVPSNAVFAFPGEFTVEGWFNWSTLPAAGQAIGVLAAGGFNFTYGSGSVSFNNYGSGSIATATYTFVVGVWYHIAMTRNVSNTCTIWINGVSIATANSAASFAQGTWTVYGGSNNGGAGYVNNLRVVKGVAVYTAAFTVPTAPLSATQSAGGTGIVAITGSATSLLTCQSNRFIDNSTNLFAITRAGSTSVQSFNPFQRNSATTMYFDGTGDYLSAPYNPGFFFGTGDFTIECWLYQVVFTSDMVITASITTWASQVNFYFGTRAGSPNILIFRAGDAIPITLNGNTGLTTNTWTHVAVSRASGVTRMFVNGVTQSATHTGSVNIGTTAQSIGIGAANNASEPINGYINDLRITKGVARYTGTFTPSTTAFITK